VPCRQRPIQGQPPRRVRHRSANRRIHGAAPNEPGWRTPHAVLSPDAKILYYLPDWKTVIARNLETSAEKIIYKEPDATAIWNWALSRDGRYLALGGPAKIRIVPTTGGEYRERLQIGATNRFFGLAWTPDGRYIVTVTSLDSGKQHEFWRIPVDGGEPVKTPLDAEYRGVSVHPDGRRVGMTSMTTKLEVWVMENFLPEVRASR